MWIVWNENAPPLPPNLAHSIWHFRLPFAPKSNLLLKWCHLLNDCPQPTLESDKSILGLARLVVERCIANQGCHVDISNPVQQQP